MKIAISNGGGDAPALNAVNRAIVRSAILNYGWEVVGIQDGFDGILMGKEPVPLTLESVKGIQHLGGTILGTSNRGNPFQYEISPGVVEDVSGRLIESLADHGVDVLVSVGGDGSLGIANRLSQMGLKCIGVPKTIDLDLFATDVTFGFDSACSVCVDALDRLATTGYSHSRVMVVETMGRTAGWIALESGIAGSADVILIPEIPYDMDVVVEKIKHRKSLGRRFSIVVVSEGAQPVGGKMTYQDGGSRLGGVGHLVASEIEDRLDVEARTVVLGHLQRGGTPTHKDRILGTRFGVKAVDLIAEGQFGHMVALKAGEYVSVPLSEATSRLNLVDPDSDDVRMAEKIGICFGR